MLVAEAAFEGDMELLVDFAVARLDRRHEVLQRLGERELFLERVVQQAQSSRRVPATQIVDVHEETYALFRNHLFDLVGVDSLVLL